MSLFDIADALNPTWSHARGGAALASFSGSVNATTAVQFHVLSPVLCIGVRFYCATSAAKTIKGKLYNAAGTLLGSASISTSATGVYEVFFTGAALTAHALYRACIWDQAGVSYFFYTPANANAPPRPFYAGGVVVYNILGMNGTGDVAPTLNPGSEFYPIEPILVAV
jgi:hypothetical protein